MNAEDEAQRVAMKKMATLRSVTIGDRRNDKSDHAYHQGFVEGARAMQAAAAKYHDDWLDRLTERSGAGHAYEIHTQSAAAICALDPEKVGG